MLPTLAIILRLITKFARLSPWGWDDYTIIVAYILLVAYVSLHVFLEDNGAGRDLWTLSDSEITHFFKVFNTCRFCADVLQSARLAPGAILADIKPLQGFYALQTLYHSCIDIIKASILFMYLRIFHLPGEKITIALWVTQVFNLMNGIIFIFVGLFQCNPVSLAWTFWTGDATGKCIDIVYLALAHAGVNIALDVWMLVLPLTQVWGMNLARRKKFAIMFMFSLGLLKDPLNPTVAMMPSVIWTDLELYVGIFTACIPTLRQFFVRFILQQSEKKKRLSSAAAEYRSSILTPKKGGSQQMSELDTVDESSYNNSP
ncbi:CFEM domain-containing protein [Colletotrichum acutatum]